ncbi:MAG: DnaA regulatory inactivator Hda, partial [Gammaproteobacteria bacterium]|nr:DnaA regulatory inactivator Hda [Gammaproteobacteria bacterium]
QVHWLWGTPGSGRSHLLQAAVAAADGRCAWLPLADAATLSPDLLEGMGALDLLCVDDVDAVAGDADWERQLFRVFEELKSGQGRLIVSASSAPTEAGFTLRDLQSRLASGPVWRLQPGNDEDLLAALQLRAEWRGLELSDKAGAFLLKRVRRSTAALFDLLDVADKAALEAQRKLTIPFLRTVLETAESGAE